MIDVIDYYKNHCQLIFFKLIANTSSTIYLIVQDFMILLLLLKIMIQLIRFCLFFSSRLLFLFLRFKAWPSVSIFLNEI